MTPQSERPGRSAIDAAFRAYTKQLIDHKPWSFLAILLPGTGVVFTRYIPPLVIAAMIRRFGDTMPSAWSEVAPYIIVLTISWLFGEALWRIAFLCLDFSDARSMRDLYNQAMRELMRKDMAFFNDNFAGALTKKTIGYAKNIEGFTDTIAFNIVGKLLPLLFASVILWTIQPILVVVLIGMIVIALACAIPFIKRRQKLTRKREALSNTVAGHIADVIGNVSAVQAFGHEIEEQQRHEQYVHEYVTAAKKSWDYHVTHVDMIVAPFYVISNVIGLVLAILISDDAATMAAVFVTFSYFVQASEILFEFNRTYRNIENALTEAAQFTELLAEPPKLSEKPNAKPIHVTKGVIEFNSVNFAYDDNKQSSLFENFNLLISPGEKVALVGHSGGGKTTVTKLLLRFVDITSGELLIDGQSVSDASLRSLRHSIAYVPQDPVMFHRSIADNIRYGRLDATDEEVIAAAKKAHADEFIDLLPKGYETMVGERGVKLSGGQRQRIAIARALIKNAPILVLDEATSALDSESEVLIQDALWKLMKGRTAIVIAHRLSTIQKMDRIIVLDKGQIAEEGTHKHLLQQKGIYAKLWGHQSGGFLED